MALSLSTHEPTETQSTTVSVPGIPWEDEYRVEQRKNDNEANLVSFVVPLDSPSTFKLQYRTINNIYNGRDISVQNRSAITKGVNLYIQNSEVWDITDSSDLTYNVKLPVSCSVNVLIPVNNLVTETEIRALIARTLAGSYEEGTSSPVSRLLAMIRGALVPKNL